MYILATLTGDSPACTLVKCDNLFVSKRWHCRKKPYLCLCAMPQSYTTQGCTAVGVSIHSKHTHMINAHEHWCYLRFTQCSRFRIRNPSATYTQYTRTINSLRQPLYLLQFSQINKLFKCDFKAKLLSQMACHFCHCLFSTGRRSGIVSLRSATSTSCATPKKCH